MIATSPVPRFARITHAVLALWLVVNGVAHQIGVLVGAARGTLRSGADVESLLVVGGGLLVAGTVVSWSLVGLWRRGATRFAMTAVGVTGLVIIAIAARYGWAFLGGTSLIALVDLVALGTFARRGSGR